MAKTRKKVSKPKKAKAPVGFMVKDVTPMDALIDLIDATPDNPRVVKVKSDEFLELVKSIKAMGVKRPIDVRNHPLRSGRFECVAGERRVKAAKAAGLKIIPALFHSGMTNEQAFDMTYAENAHRRDLTPAEQGKAVFTLMAKLGGDIDAVAVKLGQTPRWVAGRAKLQDLAKVWRDELANPLSEFLWMSAGKLQLIARYTTSVQEQLHERATRYPGQFKGNATKDLAKWLDREFMRRLASAPWSLTDKTLCKSSGACSKCRDRSSIHADLWMFHVEHDEKKAAKADRCLNVECWEAKSLAFLSATVDQQFKDHPGLLLATDDTCGYTRREMLSGELGHEVLHSGSYADCAKSTTGARSILMVSGPKLGKVIWGKLYSSRDGRPAKRAPGTPTPLSERRVKLEVKRNVKVLAMVRALLDLSNFPDDAVLFRLAVYYGVGSVSIYPKEWSDYLKWKDEIKHQRDAKQLMWEGMHPALNERMTYQSGESNIAWMIEFATAICGVLGVDIAGLQAEAAASLPEPASWAKLTPDGYPKSKATSGV